MKTKSAVIGGAGAAALLALAAAGGAQAQDAPREFKGAPEFEFGDFTIKPRGRIYLDQVWQEVDRETLSPVDLKDTRMRTARLGVQGGYGEHWSYVAEVDIKEDGAVDWEDLYVEYSPTDGAAFTVGQFKTVSLENLTSSRYITFMERGAFADVLGVGRTLNAQARVGGENWSAAVFVSGDNINNPEVPSGRPTGSEEQYAYGARVAYAPVVTDTTKVHLGAWVRRRDRADQANFSYGARNNTNFGSRYVTTGSVGVRDTQVGLEGAVVRGNLSLQGEWANARVERFGDVEDDVRAWYVFASWFPTGESRRYNAADGEFGRIKVKRPVTQGGMGALELAVRYDSADLTEVSGVSTAGEYSAWTLGANWYPHPYARLMANYTYSQNDNRLAGLDVDVQTFQLRAQFDF
ncbi:phosphate-selective porin [Phenylobacterium zucineum HLK1]|uniref:Phosphate-selective porin n=1 Tax=Phenylobacterium zucineum (strain HLK1) TaxID=450851 RepID=B4RB76_PHEZH|nr:porin [Phenylobacterium zucineum]ACG79721.1 phosphate-selective porin [Phenylobacterium zucineum HLK1]